MQKINNEQVYTCFDPWLVCFVSLIYPDNTNYYWLVPKVCRSRYQDRPFGELKSDKEVKYYSIYKNLMLITNYLGSHWKFEATL